MTAQRRTVLMAMVASAAAGLAAPAAATEYAPIDCARASSPSETAICANYVLGQDEARRDFTAVGVRIAPGTPLPAPAGVFPRHQVE